MAKQIWKFPLDITEFQTISMPRGGKIVALQLQREVPTLWVEFNPELSNITDDRYFGMIGTGHGEVPSYANYIGTVVTQGGAFVWHYYECFQQ